MNQRTKIPYVGLRSGSKTEAHCEVTGLKLPGDLTELKGVILSLPEEPGDWCSWHCCPGRIKAWAREEGSLEMSHALSGAGSLAASMGSGGCPLPDSTLTVTRQGLGQLDCREGSRGPRLCRCQGCLLGSGEPWDWFCLTCM